MLVGMGIGSRVLFTWALWHWRLESVLRWVVDGGGGATGDGVDDGGNFMIEDGSEEMCMTEIQVVIPNHQKVVLNLRCGYSTLGK